MNKDDLYFYSVLINHLGQLLNNKDKLGVSSLPVNFSGISSDLYNHVPDNAPVNDALLLFIDQLIQECEGKSDEEILRRFELVRSTLVAVYERTKADEK